jgi:SdpC family antimicrobial peptide
MSKVGLYNVKKSHDSMRARHFVIMALCVSIALEPANGPQAARAEAMKIDPTFSARQIFQGIFFGVGPVAAELPEMWNDDSRRLLHLEGAASMSRFERQISAIEVKVSHSDPSYFRDFAEAMTSGDPALVSDAFERTNRVLGRLSPQAAAAAHKVIDSSGAADTSAPRPDLFEFQQIKINWGIFFTNYIFIFIVIFVILIFFTFVIPLPLIAAETDTFSYDSMVALVASRLDKTGSVTP